MAPITTDLASFSPDIIDFNLETSISERVTSLISNISFDLNHIIHPLKLARMPMNRLRELLKLTPQTFPILSDWIAGMAVGTLFITLFSRLRLALGDSSDVTIALLLTGSLAVTVCVAFWQRPGKILTSIAFWLIACWSLLQPAVLKLALNSVGQFSLEQLGSATTQLGITFIVVLTSVFPFALAATVIASRPTLKRNSFVAGIAVSLFSVPLFLSWIGTPAVVQWAAIAAAAILGTVRFIKRQATATVQVHAVVKAPLYTKLEANVFVVCLGAALAVALFLGRQLMLNNLISEFALFSGFIAGLAGAGLIRQALSGTQKWLLLAIWSSAIILSYPTLTYLALSETVWISNVLLLLGCRSLLLGCLTFPIGVLFFSKTSPESPVATNSLTSMLSLSCGFALALWSGLSVTMVIVGLVAVSILVAVGKILLLKEFPRTRIQQLSIATACGVVVLGLVMLPRLDPSRSEKILFTGNTYTAFRSGIDWSLLPWIDDARVVADHSNLNSRWSLWKQRGQQVMVRENGLITEIKTENVTACPLSASEVLPSLIPLVAHPTAEHVLVLGMHATTLHTCESFPLRTVTVLENSDFFDQKQSWITSVLLDSSDFRFVNADLQLGMQAQHAQSYDVIIAPHAMAANTAGLAQMTREFYQAVNSQLAENGLFCQRLAFYDLGPETVRELVATLKSVFPQVLVIESIPGEALLIGARQSESLITPELVGRLQLPHARRILSQMGWDWSIPASRGTLDDQAVHKWIADSEIALSIQKLNSVFQLPAEIARWETKSIQTRQELAKHGMAMGGYLGEGDESLDIQQRLEDLRLAQSILNNSPDNIWGYRAALKKQLTERPRAKIVQMKHEGLKRRLHPDDQRRKDYIETLGKLAKTESPTLEMVNELIQYMQPFDPLLGPFVSNETIHQLKRVETSTDSAQYFNLLYSIYFSTAADKSVRNVCMATKLLCEHPEIVSDEADRWDQLNGLVEIFRHRWQMRFQDRKRQSSYETIDTERSMAAIKLAVSEMEKLSAAAGLSSADWDARQEIIQESLVRPLSIHRSQQLRKRQVVK